MTEGTWQPVQRRSFRLKSAPVYKGFVARSYGPRRAHTIPRQSQMYWTMTSRGFVKWLERQSSRKR